MTLLEFVVLLFVAGICGSIAQGLVGYSRTGCLGSIALGFIGALLGRWLAVQMDLPELFTVTVGDRPFPVVWSIIGASIFAALLSFVARGSRPIDE
ncbi:MAG TPA: hypothetical protein VG713_20165 [Pirellulales bacterium]|jgi:uncharacterized membrane protein YeaQ/YmgE (transglycosylase-associated protein family)|nr:hypothetical protein [Pirellulales bacterium]